MVLLFVFFFSSRRRHTRWTGDWSSDVCSSDLTSSGQYTGPLYHLLPFVEQQPLFNASWSGTAYDPYIAVPGSTNPYPTNIVHSQAVQVYACPTDTTYGQPPNDPANWGPGATASYAINFQ